MGKQPKKVSKKRKIKDPFSDSSSMEAIEARISLDALKLAHKQILDGTASSQVQVHFLKAASSKEKIEKAKLRGEISLINAKVDNIKAQRETQELYNQAIAALKSYGSQTISNSGVEVESDDQD